MTQFDKVIIANFCRDNLHAHTDWTGTRLETIEKCDSVEKFIDKIINCLENREIF